MTMLTHEMLAIKGLELHANVIIRTVEDYNLPIVSAISLMEVDWDLLIDHYLRPGPNHTTNISTS